jgi:hypothetical protein
VALSDEVSTESGSDRVIVAQTSPVALVDDPVAIAPGTDSAHLAGFVNGVNRLLLQSGRDAGH